MQPDECPQAWVHARLAGVSGLPGAC